MPASPLSLHLWFTSDHHFGHDNIRTHCQRPFNFTEEINEAMIAHWNACVAPSDTVYHLGDLFLCPLEEAKAIRRRLHGNICLIRGNPDKTADRMRDSFGWIKDYHELKVEDADPPSGKQLIILWHYAFRVWRNAHRGSWHLYGHSHGYAPRRWSLNGLWRGLPRFLPYLLRASQNGLRLSPGGKIALWRVPKCMPIPI